LDDEGPSITLLWVLSHKGIPGNEIADQAAKEVLDEDISTTERYLPDDLKKLGLQKKRPKMEKWKQRDKKRKPDVNRKEDTKIMRRKEQMAIFKLRTGYTRATHGSNMEGVSHPLCFSCNTHLSVDHILWECKETEDQTTNLDMKKEQWNNGKKVMGKIIDYPQKKSDCTMESRNGKTTEKYQRS
jgi:hypothetical protein